MSGRADPGTCRECGWPMRRHGVKVADAPGTKPRQKDGQCTSCAAKHRAPRPKQGGKCNPAQVQRGKQIAAQYGISRLLRGVPPGGMPLEVLYVKTNETRRPLP
jgi:hypothetical protein